MTKEEILNKIKQLLVAVYPQSEEHVLRSSMDSKLADDLGLNSMGILCMVIAIEEEFGIEFEGTSFSDFPTVGSVVDYIDSQIKNE